MIMMFLLDFAAAVFGPLDMTSLVRYGKCR